MSAKYTDNTVQLVVKVDRNSGFFLRLLADGITDEAAPKTPYSGGKRPKGNSATGGGHLRDDVLKQVLGLRATIQWAKNYAEIQENKQFGHYTTPGTGPHFAENAVRKVVKNAAVYLRRARLT